MKNKPEIYLLSTVVAPAFISGELILTSISKEELVEYLKEVKPGNNLCGHPVTNNLLRNIVPSLPEPVPGFWHGNGIGIAVRPKNGVRGAAVRGDTAINNISDMEWIKIRFRQEKQETSFFSVNCNNYNN